MKQCQKEEDKGNVSVSNPSWTTQLNSRSSYKSSRGILSQIEHQSLSERARVEDLLQTQIAKLEEQLKEKDIKLEEVSKQYEKQLKERDTKLEACNNENTQLKVQVAELEQERKFYHELKEELKEIKEKHKLLEDRYFGLTLQVQKHLNGQTSREQFEKDVSDRISLELRTPQQQNSGKNSPVLIAAVDINKINANWEENKGTPTLENLFEDIKPIFPGSKTRKHGLQTIVHNQKQIQREEEETEADFNKWYQNRKKLDEETDKTNAKFDGASKHARSLVGDISQSQLAILSKDEQERYMEKVRKHARQYLAALPQSQVTICSQQLSQFTGAKKDEEVHKLVSYVSQHTQLSHNIVSQFLPNLRGELMNTQQMEEAENEELAEMGDSSEEELVLKNKKVIAARNKEELKKNLRYGGTQESSQQSKPSRKVLRKRKLKENEKRTKEEMLKEMKKHNKKLDMPPKYYEICHNNQKRGHIWRKNGTKNGKNRHTCRLCGISLFV